jgi:hypothetical protein
MTESHTSQLKVDFTDGKLNNQDKQAINEFASKSYKLQTYLYYSMILLFVVLCLIFFFLMKNKININSSSNSNN